MDRWEVAVHRTLLPDWTTDSSSRRRRSLRTRGRGIQHPTDFVADVFGKGRFVTHQCPHLIEPFPLCNFSVFHASNNNDRHLNLEFSAEFFAARFFIIQDTPAEDRHSCSSSAKSCSTTACDCASMDRQVGHRVLPWK